MENLTQWKQLLKHLLVGRESESAARLLQNLINSPKALELGGFDYKRMGFSRFKDFLNACSDTVALSVSPHGDMLVAPQDTAKEKNPSSQEGALPIRGDVWIAFSNPDPGRIRFLNRFNGHVFHQLVHEGQVADDISPGEDWVQVNPVSAEEQASWMRDFAVQTEGLAPEEFPVLNQPYRTSINGAFARALGPLGKRWNKYRTEKIAEAIREWCDKAGVDARILSPGWSVHPKMELPSPVVERPVDLSPRSRALKLIDTLTEDEISNILIPLIASIIMVKTHR